MTLAEEIIAARKCGVIRCGLSALRSPTLAELAREFGLGDDPSCYEELDESAARQLLRAVLHRDMAYNEERMTETQSADLADRFLTQFGPGTLYYSNVWRPVVRPDGMVQSATWNPVTDATFDAGVLAVGPKISGCLWIEDED